jgi:hypothetical protein
MFDLSWRYDILYTIDISNMELQEAQESKLLAEGINRIGAGELNAPIRC